MKKNSGGFVLLEVMTVMMIVLVLASALYGLAGAEYRRTMRQVQEDEAYYTALAAVRLMAQEVTEHTEDENGAVCELTCENGMKRRKTELLFEPEDGEWNESSRPVTIWSKWDHETLVLAAEAETGKRTCLVKLKLRLEELEEEIRWVPIAYEVER